MAQTARSTDASRAAKRADRVVSRQRRRGKRGSELEGLAALAPLVNERKLPSGAGLAPATARQLMAWQETHGNQYVKRVVERDAGGESLRGDNPHSNPLREGEETNGRRRRADTKEAERATRSVRRSGVTEAAPAINRITLLPGMVAASTLAAQEQQRDRMRLTLRKVGVQLAEVRTQLRKLGEDDTLADSDDLIDEIDEIWSPAINSSEPIPSYLLEDFPAFVEELQTAHDQGLSIVRARTAAELAVLADEEAPDMSGALADLQEAAHVAFSEGDEDSLQPVVDGIDKVMTHQKEVAKLLKWAKDAASLVEAAETVAELDKALGKVKGAGGVLEKVSKVVRSAQAIATITGLDKKAAAGYAQDIDRMEAAMDLIDVSGVIDAIPLLGTLWSKYYLPATKLSLKMLRGIGRHRSVEGRAIGFIKFQETGKLPPGARRYFPGGEPVLRFMLRIMKDEEPAPSASVKRFFLEHRETLNLPFEASWAQLESEGGWFSEERLTNLLPWLKQNKHLVWAMLYGSFEVY